MQIIKRRIMEIDNENKIFKNAFVCFYCCGLFCKMDLKAVNS